MYQSYIIKMGNCEDCTPLNKNKSPDFNFDMVQVINKTLDTNLSVVCCQPQENQRNAPSSHFAKKVSQRPQLLQKVKLTLNEQTYLQPIKYAGTRGIQMPVFYIESQKAFYEGQWQAGKPHGKGKLYMKNGCFFEGSFKEGQAEGNDGLFIYPDGSYKRGQIKNSKMDGQGKFVYKPNGMIYEGQWAEDQPHGEGRQSFADGSFFEGSFFRGQKHGDNCVYQWANGKRYVGSFKKGYLDGYGTLTMNSSSYKGEFSGNQIIGDSVLKTQMGEYNGPFVNGEMHGIGTFKWKDGKVYEGRFERNKLHGKGTIFFPNGQKAAGEWHQGENVKLQIVSAIKMTKTQRVA